MALVLCAGVRTAPVHVFHTFSVPHDCDGGTPSAPELVSSGATGAPAGSQRRGACQVDVRIGIVQSTKELDIELPDDADPEKVLADIEAALAEDGTILWLTDRKGRQVGVPVGKVAYVELDPPSSDRRVGFGIA
jgi:hypothetical protein